MASKYGSSVYLCNTCGELKRSEEFYKSSNPLHYEGVIPMCKTCIKANMTDDESAQNTLRVIDRPFMKEIWDNANNGTGCRIGRYFQILGTSKYKAMSYADSNFGDDNVIDSKGNEISDDEIGKLQDEWGFGYSPREYHYFEKKYQSLKANYPVNTSLHTEALRTYCVYKVKAEMATASGDVKDAKMWGEMAQKQGEIARINLNKLTKNDLSQGVDSFSEVARLVEKEVDIIPILPQFIEKPNDKLDVAILSFINYSRRMKGMEDVEHHEMYNFYQDNLRQYLDDDTKNPEIKKKIVEIEITTERGNKKKILFYDVYAVIEERKQEYPDNQFIQNLDKWMELVSYFRWFPDAFYQLMEAEEGGGIRLDADQKFVLRCLARFPNNYIVFPRGYGKCVSGDTLLQSKEGLKQIKDFFPNVIENGEEQIVDLEVELMNRYGLYEKTVKGVYSGYKPTKKIVLDNGYKIEVTLKHPLLVEGEWKKAIDINIGDKIDIQDNFYSKDKRAKFTSFKVKSIEDSENHVYDLQMSKTHSFIGNGFINHNTMLELMSAYHACILTPNLDYAMTAQTRENSASLIGSKWKEIQRSYPMIANELTCEPRISKDIAEVRFKSGSVLDNLSNTRSSLGQRR